MAKPKTEAADYKRQTIRLPEDVWQCLRADAKKADRALNTHIVRVFRELYRERLAARAPIL